MLRPFKGKMIGKRRERNAVDTLVELKQLLLLNINLSTPWFRRPPLHVSLFERTPWLGRRPNIYAFLRDTLVEKARHTVQLSLFKGTPWLGRRPYMYPFLTGSWGICRIVLRTRHLHYQGAPASKGWRHGEILVLPVSDDWRKAMDFSMRASHLFNRKLFFCTQKVFLTTLL